MHQLFVKSDLAVAIDTVSFKSKSDCLHYQTLDIQFNLHSVANLIRYHDGVKAKQASEKWNLIVSGLQIAVANQLDTYMSTGLLVLLLRRPQQGAQVLQYIT